MSNRLPYYLTAFFTAILAGLVYIPSLQNGFVWDDDLYVTVNPNIRSLDWGFFKWALTANVSANWHPVTLLSHAVDYAFWGLDPFGHHLTSIVFHSLNSGLVFALSVLLIRKASGERPSSAKTLAGALVAALLFGLHPLRVESVSWVSERKDVLSAFFFLLGLLAYLRYASPERKRVFPFYPASLVLFMLALMSKPMAVSLPVVLVILDFFLLKRFGFDARRAVVEKIPFFALSAASSALTLWAQGKGEAVRTLVEVPIAGRIAVSVKAYAFYIYKTFLPFNLSPFYPLPGEGEYFGLLFFISLFVMAGATVFFAARGKKHLPFWLYYLATLVPVIGIVQVGSQAAADRYTYIPGIGLYIIIGLAVSSAYSASRSFWPRALLATVLVAMTAFISVKTIRQQAVWKDPVSLWSRVIDLYPEQAPTGVYNNRGVAYKAVRDYGRAIRDFTRAIEIDPGYAAGYNNRGLAYFEAGDPMKALEDFNAAISIDPEFLNPYFNRGLVYAALEDYPRAAEDYTRVISKSPGHADVHLMRGIAYRAMGMSDPAVEDFNAAISIDPANRGAYFQRGLLRLDRGSFTGAVEDLETAASLDPGNAAAYYNLGVAYDRLGMAEKARENLEKALSLGFGAGSSR